MTLSRILIAATIVALPALSACQTTSQQPAGQQTNAGDPRPPDAKAAIFAIKNSVWTNPEEIVTAAISPPRPGIGQWGVCVRTTQKSRFSDKLVSHYILFAVYDDGRPPAVLSITPSIFQCGTGNYPPYDPFPELQGGYKPPTPAKGA